MVASGHVLIGVEGELLSIDRQFCDIMRAERDEMVGRLVLDVTAPADRIECSEAISKLRETHKPFKISKRFIRDDGSLVWVTNSVSIVESGGGPALIVATIDPLVDSGSARAPARLLDSARFLVSCKDDRASICDPSLFPDTAWDAILAAYLAEAEGRAVDVPTLSRQLGISVERAGRWVDILLKQQVIEIETRRADAYAPKSFRLTAATHARLEDHLSKVDLRAPAMIASGAIPRT